jgi:hypothetical protein
MELVSENCGASCDSQFGSINLTSAYKSKYFLFADTGQYHDVMLSRLSQRSVIREITISLSGINNLEFSTRPNMTQSPGLNKIHVEDLQCETKISFNFLASWGRNDRA